MSANEGPEIVPVREERDIVIARRAVRRWALALRFSLVDQTKLVTAVSEITRNALDHAGGGELSIAEIRGPKGRGLFMVCTDQGPGIADLARAFEDGYSTGQGLGLGLSGAKRLVGHLEVHSEPGRGTRVELRKWP